MKLRDMIDCGCCAALLTVCAWLAVPLGDIAVTMQTFGLFLTLMLLGGRKGTAACGVYLVLGAVGLPVFTGFQGGFGVLLGPTGGYLWGFLILCLVYWVLEKPLGQLPSLILGLLLCYACGTVWFAMVYHASPVAVILKCVLPYLIPDGLKLLLARSVSKRMKL